MDNKTRVFYAAIDEFKKYGMKFTMQGLAKSLGISKRTLYETYPSKEKLIEMMITETYFDVKRQQKEILEDATLSTIEKLKKTLLIVPIYASFSDYRRAYEIFTVYPNLYDMIIHSIENDWDTTLDLLQKSMDEGYLKQNDLILIKHLLCGIFEHLLKGNPLIEHNISYADALTSMITMIFEGIEK